MKLVPALLVLALAPHAAGAQRGSLPRPSAGVVAGEVGAGMAGSVVGMLAGAAVGSLVDRGPHERPAVFLGLAAGAVLGSAGGVTLVGTRGRAEGSLAAAAAGSLAGAAVALAADRAVQRLPLERRRRVRRLTYFLLPSAGATVGFNLSRR